MPIYDARSDFSINRRRLLQSAAGAMTLFSAPSIVHALGDPKAGSLFTLGVCSGDPTARSVMLWTRLAPDPLVGGGLGSRSVRVQIEVALDPAFKRVIRSGSRLARPENGHVVNILVGGLPPSTRLFYRFRALGQSSRVGITRTFPRCQDSPGQVRFAVVSCQNYNQGFYTAYSDMVAQDVDFVIHTGDYIYEGGPTSTPIAPDRRHEGPEIFSVEDYRNRYALYRLDPDLQNAHAAVPFLVTWDDHEVDNNYAGLQDEKGGDPADFAARRRNAYQVYRESMPLPWALLRENGELPIYRTLPYGDLADIHLLDTRQYRTNQPAGDNFGSTDDDLTTEERATLETFLGETLFDEAGILSTAATLLGVKQEAWLARQLRRSQAQWNVLAQQMMVTRWNLVTTGRLSAALQTYPTPLPQPVQDALGSCKTLLNVDAWDGYVAARKRLFDLIDWADMF
jgi:alkaline phosphatase D